MQYTLHKSLQHSNHHGGLVAYWVRLFGDALGMGDTSVAIP
jgi:hypothetical protein